MRSENSGGSAIPEHLHGRRGNTRGDHTKQIRRDAGIPESIINKVPLQPVESLLQINFDGHPTSLALLGSHRVHHLLGDDDIVYNAAPLDEAGLVMGDECREDLAETVSKDFGEDFVDNRAQTNGTEVFKVGRVRELRYKSYQSPVKFWIEGSSIPHALNH